MSPENADLIRAKEKLPIANRVIRKGLLIGDGITLKTWSDIFKMDLPAGRTILEVGDEAGFAAARASQLDNQNPDESDDNNEDQLQEIDNPFNDTLQQRLGLIINEEGSLGLTSTSPSNASNVTP